jgi:cytochrome b561
MPAATVSNREARYDSVTIALHWLIGTALLAEIAFGFLLDDIAPRNTPARAEVINLHKSIGIVLGLLVVLRLAWHVRHPPPAWPASLPAWQQRAAVWGHRAMYACMVVIPLAGYVASNFSKYGVRFFGLALRPWGRESPAVYAFFNGLHDVVAWLFCALIAGHVLIALKHGLVDRDGLFTRMSLFRRKPI